MYPGLNEDKDKFKSMPVFNVVYKHLSLPGAKFSAKANAFFK